MSARQGSTDPASVPDVEDAYTPPATETERVVAGIWAEVLDLPRVSVTDNFFDMGGHSVLIHAVQQGILRELGQDRPVVELFQHSTVRALAHHLDGGSVAQDGRAGQRVPGNLTRIRAQRARRTRDGRGDDHE